MALGDLSMGAAAAVLDVLEPLAVVRMERLDNLRRQLTFHGELAQPRGCCLDRLMPRSGFFPSVLRMLAAPRIGETQRADYRWKHQPLAHQGHQNDGKCQEQDQIAVRKWRPARCRKRDRERRGKRDDAAN